MMNTIILDLEFSGLDNTYVKDNEITQVKLLNAATGDSVCQKFLTNKPVSVYDRVYGGIESYTGDVVFSQAEFSKALELVGGKLEDCEFHGYSVQQDRLMLAKYGINITINDMQEMMRLNPVHEAMLAIGCASMECAYFLLTGKMPSVGNHYKAGIVELELLNAIHAAVSAFDPEEQNEYLTVMPFGHCAGMPISEYVSAYRRAADGYRYNNDDLLSKSLTNAIPSPAYCGLDHEEFDHEDDDFENEDSDDEDDDFEDEDWDEE